MYNQKGGIFHIIPTTMNRFSNIAAIHSALIQKDGSLPLSTPSGLDSGVRGVQRTANAL